MKQGDKLVGPLHKSRRSKPQSGYIGITESQLKALVNVEDFDKIPVGETKSMSGRRVYGYDSVAYERGWPRWNYTGKWLRKRIGKPKASVEKEFIELWKQRKMDNWWGGEGPIKYLDNLVDREKEPGRWRRGYYWDENEILRMYPERRLWKNDWPDYSTYEKRKANKLTFKENEGKLSGLGPIGIGKYFIDEDRGKELHAVMAVRTDLWNQDLPESEHFEKSNTWRECPKASLDFLHYLHTNYKPVNILGVGVKTAVETENSKILNLGSYREWMKQYVRYVFISPK